MTVTLELNPDLDIRLRELAQARGLEVDAYLLELIEEAVEPPRKNASALSLLRSWEKEDATEEPSELADRQSDWEGFKAALNEAHSSDRILFP